MVDTTDVKEETADTTTTAAGPLTDRQQAIFDKIQPMIAERLGEPLEKVTLDAEFVGDLNADSLDLVELIMTLEKEYDLEIKDEDAENIRTLRQAVNYLDEHLPE